MAERDTSGDPTIERELYGEAPPSLADTAPLYQDMEWPPAHWPAGEVPETPEDEVRRAAGLPPIPHGQQIGPDGAPVAGPELAAAPLAPATAPPVTPPTPDPAAPPAGLQPGLGVPAAALDINVPPTQTVGPPPEGAPLPPPGDIAAPVPPPPPYGAAPAGPPPGPIPFGPQPVPGVAQLPGIQVSSAGEQPLPPVPSFVRPGDPDSPLPSARADVQQDPFAGMADEQARHYVESATPQQLVDLQRGIETQRRTSLALQQAQIDENNLRQLRADQDARAKADAASQVKTDQIVVDAQKLATTKIDPDRWMSTRTGGQRLAGFIAAVVGGLVQGKTGSARNIGMDMIQQHIDRDIEAQKGDIESGKYALGVRQNAVAQEFARTGNLYQATEIVRLATYQAATNKLLTDQQNFDARGSGFASYGVAIKEMQGRQAAATEAIRKTTFEEGYKVEQLTQANQKQADERWKAHQDVALGWAKEGHQGDKGPKIEPSVWHAANPENPIPPWPMTAKDYGQFLQERKTGQEIHNQQRSVTHVVPGVTVRNATGQEAPFVASGTPESVEKLRKQQTAVSQIVGLIDEAKRVRTGWTTNIGNTAERQKLNAIWGSAKVAAKNAAELGQITESDVELIKGMLGTDDPSKLRDPIPGMDEARKILVRNLNIELHGHGFPRDQQYEIAPPPADPRPEEQLQGKTVAELGHEAEPGFLLRHFNRYTPEERIAAAENTPSGPTGLALDDTTRIVTATRAYATAAPAQQRAILDQLTAWTSSDRPSIASGVLGLVRGENPALYETLVARLSPSQRESLPDYSSLGLPGGNLPPLPTNKPLADNVAIPKDR